MGRGRPSHELNASHGVSQIGSGMDTFAALV